MYASHRSQVDDAYMPDIWDFLLQMEQAERTCIALRPDLPHCGPKTFIPPKFGKAERSPVRDGRVQWQGLCSSVDTCGHTGG